MKNNKMIKAFSTFAIVVLMLCAAPVMEHFGVDVSVTAQAAKSGYFTYTTSWGEATITKVDPSISGDVVIPDKFGIYEVTGIEHGAFNGCFNVDSISIGSNLKNFQSGAFAGCFVKKFIVRADNNVVYGGADGCLYSKDKTVLFAYPAGNLQKTFTIPDGVNNIHNFAFYAAQNLAEVIIPDSVATIGGFTFAYCRNLASINLPDAVKTINDYCFAACVNLKTINLPENLETICNSAFSCNLRLTNISIPETCKTIEPNSFSSCLNLTECVIPESVKNIGEYAFDGCISMKKILVYSDDVEIGDYAFGMTDMMLKSGFSINDFLKLYENSFFLLDEDLYNKEVEKMKQMLVSYDSYRPFGAVIYCNEGSTVETYAKSNGITYTYFSEHAHEYTSKTIRDATCLTTGLKACTCTICGKSYTKTISKTGHKYATKTTKATTSKNGKSVKYCTVCGKTASSKTIYKISSIKLSSTSYTYNGKVKTPSVTVKDSKGNTLKKDTDYTVKYASGRKAVGTYKVQITFKGKYSGSKTLSFKIVLGQVKNVKQNTNYKGLYLSWSKVTGAKGYQIQELKNGKWTDLVRVENGYSKNSIHNKSVRNKVTIRIRGYYFDKNGKYYYGTWSTAKAFTGR